MKLLNKTILTYFIFSAIVVFAAVPVFYLALRKVMIKNADENLISSKTRMMPRLQNEVANNDTGSFNFYDYEISYGKELPNKQTDSIDNFNFGNDSSGEFLPGRRLNTHLIINREFYSLHIRTSMVDRFSLIKKITLILIILLIVMLAGLLFINKILSKKIWQPFYNTLKKVQKYRVDKEPSLTLANGLVKEFNDLNNVIEELTERNHQAYISQKQFTENASHEMQSPLAVFQSKLELLMQTKPLNEEQASLIEDLADASKRLLRLNKSLLLLTKIENKQFLEKEKISIKEILQKLLLQYEFQTNQKSLFIKFEDDADIVIDINKTLAEILLGNLLSNAIRYNIMNGSINISVKENKLIIQNSGQPFSLDTEKLFQRFQKQGSDPDSIGLGLEIIKKICELYHYKLAYNFIDSTHSFSIIFKCI